MKKSQLYTATGDQGTTSLIGGQRIDKSAPRIEAYGTVDELNSHIGLLAAHTAGDQLLAPRFPVIQSRLFDIGSSLATPPSP
ncbi:MAG: ATP:cob(I)alamin adenosyltransferase, partial [Paramuribaculum sp.]|nr:ATP:cob(I)alamin adenosyltransferase [Paramuribaculum sp.]